jgi:uncharacterized protein (TIGR02453 family)
MFNGFSKELLKFYEGLGRNNIRDWFMKHKDDYQQYVLDPAKSFVEMMGERFRTISPQIIADTRTNGSGSIFRIQRDTRFSQDKTPYKTHLGIYFWAGPLAKKENPGFYLQVEPARLMLFAGIHKFSSAVLSAYRNEVSDPKRVAKLQEAIGQVTASGRYKIGGRHYKRVPQGYDASQGSGDMLLYNGLFATIDTVPPEEFYTKDFIDYCFSRFRDMSPIFHWLLKLVKP